ncbi:MAG: diaminopimelate epimerase [Verrucomicrobiia bacterium]
MRLEFWKMNGAGNDFIMIDNRSQTIKLVPNQIIKLCHRQKGIGADGIIMLIPCKSGNAEWAWQFYNSDGSCAEMCGNGARCFAKFIQRLTGTKEKVSFETGAGVIKAYYKGDDVAINMTQPKDLQLNINLPLKDGLRTLHFINTGVPHIVNFVDDLEKLDVKSLGAEIRYHKHFAPKGTNANFVQALGNSSIRVRTYERGVENETLACGTGITASALISSIIYGFNSPIKVLVQSGDKLEVSFEKSDDGFKNVVLTGPAEFVFNGVIEI